MENVNIENNAEMPIAPTWFTQNGDKSHIPLKQGQKNGYEYFSTGLSKREYFAAVAMQGLLTRVPKRHDNDTDLGVLESERIAEEAVIMADKILAALSNK